ncbi:hypothetical protein ACFQDG_02350 [Natronoarchaeum mannanilyticum]|uniref:Uncharacterized protein n=1 Tax=Natronoarchaeum mannanilyticum TaxID=926360 RepID=A0AAV3T7D8_9EURY
MAQQEAVSADEDAEAGDDAAEHPPTVELSLYELDVSVRGSESDSLEDVEASAKRLMDYLVEQHHRLEDGPEDHQVI